MVSASFREQGEQEADARHPRAQVPAQLPLAGLVAQVVAQLDRGRHRGHIGQPRGAIEEREDPAEEEDQAGASHRGLLRPSRRYSPVKRGFLFSRKADVPSILSGDSNVIAWAIDSKARPAPSGIWLEAFTAALASRTARGPSARTRSAIARAAAISSARGTTWLTSPASSAFRASQRAAVRIISFARPRPTMRGSRCVPPAPGMIPRLGSGRPKIAFS